MKRLIAKWRLLFGFCPECNSSAPKLDNCEVCFSYRGDYPPSKVLKNIWMRNWEIVNKEKDHHE